MIGRLLCWLGRHEYAQTLGRSGFVVFLSCRREGCLFYRIREGI